MPAWMVRYHVDLSEVVTIGAQHYEDVVVCALERIEEAIRLFRDCDDYDTVVIHDIRHLVGSDVIDANGARVSEWPSGPDGTP